MDADDEERMRDDREVWLEEHDAALVAATRRQCAEAVCNACKQADIFGAAERDESSSWLWVHKAGRPDDSLGWALCSASAIWALADREPEGSA